MKATTTRLQVEPWETLLVKNAAAEENSRFRNGGIVMGYQALANAVVVQAAKDYKKALRTIKKHPGSRGAMAEARKLEKFFHSSWYCVLTDVNPDYLINRLRREAAK